MQATGKHPLDRERQSPKLRCDGFGCIEMHPVDHEMVGQPGFELGYWLGWLYLDLNRPDLSVRPLRFCGARCLEQ